MPKLLLQLYMNHLGFQLRFLHRLFCQRLLFQLEIRLILYYQMGQLLEIQQFYKYLLRHHHRLMLQ